MVLLIFICLFGISTTSVATTNKGPILQNWELKLVEDIFGQCNNDIDCPKGLICEKNACTKPENAKSIQRMDCKDKISTKKCKKLKKKGKCEDKKTYKKCMETCQKCTPVMCDPATTCSGHGTCTEDGSCKCSDGFYGDSCSIACNAAQDCSNQGICGPNGACDCDCGFFMEDCSNYCHLQLKCNGHGTCKNDGSCQCHVGFYGDDCSTTTPTTTPTTPIEVSDAQLWTYDNKTMVLSCKKGEWEYQNLTWLLYFIGDPEGMITETLNGRVLTLVPYSVEAGTRVLLRKIDGGGPDGERQNWVIDGNREGFFTIGHPSSEFLLTMSHNNQTNTTITTIEGPITPTTTTSTTPTTGCQFRSGDARCTATPTTTTTTATTTTAEPIILVSTGLNFSSATTTEIINTDNSGLTCKDLGEYPLQINSAVGFNVGSLPVICGGDDGSAYLNQCYRMESGIWKPFVNLAQGRGGAAGISYAQSSIIFGGRSDSLGILSSTEIITEQGVSPGPEMPKRVYTHAIASVNETTSILTGGHSPGGGVMEKTWFFCHVSQQFQKGPSLITARRFHASGTIQDKVTMENIVAVIGGSGRKPQGYYADFLNSTELLFNGESAWQQGPQMPKELYLQSAVEIGGDLYLIGGLFNDGSCECKMDLIQRMSCSARVCTLTTMTQKLKVARGAAVGIKIPRSFCVPV